MNKYLKITIIILIILAIAGIAYYLLKDNEQIKKIVGDIFPTSSKTGEQPTPGEEQNPSPKLQTLTDVPVFDYWIDKTNGDIYYLLETGEIIRKTATGDIVASSQTFSNVSRLDSSANGRFALIKLTSQNKNTFSIFDINSNSWQPLPDKTINASWSPVNDNEIAFLTDKDLNVLDLSTKKTSKIMDMSQKEMEMAWASPTFLILSPMPTLELTSDVWVVNMKDRTLKPIIREEYGVTLNWSKESDLGLKLFNIKRKAYLSLIDKSGVTLNTFNFLTMPSKCLIENRKIYCGVPKNIIPSVKLPDDYLKKAVYFDDAFYAIDLTGTGVTELKTEADLKLDAEHLIFYGDHIYFKNRIDNKLYKLNANQ